MRGNVAILPIIDGARGAIRAAKRAVQMEIDLAPRVAAEPVAGIGLNGRVHCRRCAAPVQPGKPCGACRERVGRRRREGLAS